MSKVSLTEEIYGLLNLKVYFFFFLPFGYIFVCSISADLKVRFHGKFADTNAWGEAPFHGKQYLVLIFNFAE